MVVLEIYVEKAFHLILIRLIDVEQNIQFLIFEEFEVIHSLILFFWLLV